MPEQLYDTVTLRYWLMDEKTAITTVAMTGRMSIYPAFLRGPHPRHDDCFAIKGLSAFMFESGVESR